MATGRRNDPEEELRFAHYDASAEQMRRLNGSFRRSLWWNLGNAIVLITITIITVGLISAGRADNISIPKHDSGSQLAASFFCRRKPLPPKGAARQAVNANTKSRQNFPLISST